MDLPELQLPELPKCELCNNDARFVIQKKLDNGSLPNDISIEYNVTRKDVLRHIEEHHREKLISYGLIDYAVRKKAVNMAEILLKMIETWNKTLETRTDFKDSDVLKAIELYQKMQGSLVEKHEVTIKRSVDDAVKEFLEKD